MKPGDTVIFGKWSGTEVTIDGQDLLIMNESDIMRPYEGQLEEESRSSGTFWKRNTKMAAKDVKFDTDARTACSRALMSWPTRLR